MNMNIHIYELFFYIPTTIKVRKPRFGPKLWPQRTCPYYELLFFSEQTFLHILMSI